MAPQRAVSESASTEDRFFDLLESQAAIVEEGTAAFARMLEEGADPAAVRDTVKDHESRGDEKTHELFTHLATAFLQPTGRGSVARLARSLDDVLDFAYATANHLHLYEISEYPAPLKEAAGILRDQGRLLHEALVVLRDPDRHDGIHEKVVEVNALENRADEVTNNAKAALFHGDDVKFILKMKDVYEYVETATDKCEDAADVIRDIVVRNGA